MNTTNPASRFAALDSLRGIAAIMVVLFHFSLVSNHAYFEVLKFGCSGVDLFFIISGFVIFMSVEKQSVKKFAINRVFRLYPPYILAVLFAFFCYKVLLHSHTLSYKILLYNLTMFQTLAVVENVDEPFWTLYVEMCFYIWVICFVQLQKYVIKLNTEVLLLLVLLTTIAFHLFGELVPNYHSILHVFPLLKRLPLFLSGMVFYRIHLNGYNRLRLFLILLSFLANCYFFHLTDKVPLFINQTEYILMIVFYFGAFFLLISGLLKPIENRYLLFFGTISYSLYLFHNPVAGVLLPKILPFVHFTIVAFLSTFLLCMSIATAITFSVERPFISMIKRKTK